jgi:hypothetical protein
MTIYSKTIYTLPVLDSARQWLCHSDARQVSDLPIRGPASCGAAVRVKPRARLCEGIYIVDSPQRNPKGCKENSRWSESAETTGRVVILTRTPEVPDLTIDTSPLIRLIPSIAREIVHLPHGYGYGSVFTIFAYGKDQFVWEYIPLSSYETVPRELRLKRHDEIRFPDDGKWP